MAEGWRGRYPGVARAAVVFAIVAIVLLAIAPIGAALGFIPWQVSVLMFVGGVAIYGAIKAADRWL